MATSGESESVPIVEHELTEEEVSGSTHRYHISFLLPVTSYVYGCSATQIDERATSETPFFKLLVETKGKKSATPSVCYSSTEKYGILYPTEIEHGNHSGNCEDLFKSRLTA